MVSSSIALGYLGSAQVKSAWPKAAAARNQNLQRLESDRRLRHIYLGI